VPQSFEQAASWYEKAANQNHVEALLDLGLLYSDGRGVTKDPKRALALFRRSAGLGESFAQYQVGLAYDIGNGVRKDQKEAIKWYRKSAEQGLPGAQFNLAMRLSNQPSEVYYWMSLATPQFKGNTNGDVMALAIKLRDEAAATLTPAERAEVDKRIQEWQATHPQQPQ
jgi:TPR repeat protein